MIAQQIIIPVLAVFGSVLAALFGAGWLLLLYFGSEALLAAAREALAELMRDDTVAKGGR